MEYLSLIISFILGGGITVFTSYRIKKKSDKLEFADRAIQFTENYSQRLMARVSIMEGEIKQLSKFKCERTDCQIRIPLRIPE